MYKPAYCTKHFVLAACVAAFLSLTLHITLGRFPRRECGPWLYIYPPSRFQGDCQDFRVSLPILTEQGCGCRAGEGISPRYSFCTPIQTSQLVSSDLGGLEKLSSETWVLLGQNPALFCLPGSYSWFFFLCLQDSPPHPDPNSGTPVSFSPSCQQSRLPAA